MAAPSPPAPAAPPAGAPLAELASREVEPGAREVRRRLEGIVALVLVQGLFGLFPVLVKLCTDPAGGWAPRAVAFWRILVGALVLGTLAGVRHRAAFWPRPAELRRLVLLALFGIVINQVLALEGVARSSATLAGLLMVVIPVFTYALAILARQEALVPRRVLGIGIALAGTVLLVTLRESGFQGGSDPGSAPLLGSAMILANCLSYAGYLVLARTLLQRRPVLWVIAWTFLVALLALPLLALGVELAPDAPTGRAIGGLVAIVLLSTIGAYLLNTYALARVSASTTAAFIYLQPLVAGASAWLVLGERPTLWSVPPALLLFAGLGLVVRRGKRARPAASGGRG